MRLVCGSARVVQLLRDNARVLWLVCDCVRGLRLLCCSVRMVMLVGGSASILRLQCGSVRVVMLVCGSARVVWMVCCSARVAVVRIWIPVCRGVSVGFHGGCGIWNQVRGGLGSKPRLRRAIPGQHSIFPLLGHSSEANGDAVWETSNALLPRLCCSASKQTRQTRARVCCGLVYRSHIPWCYETPAQTQQQNSKPGHRQWKVETLYGTLQCHLRDSVE